MTPTPSGKGVFTDELPLRMIEEHAIAVQHSAVTGAPGANGGAVVEDFELRPQKFQSVFDLPGGGLGQDKLLLGFRSSNAAQIIHFAYLTGMRAAEIFKLTWDKVDPKGRTIRLAAAGTKTSGPRVSYRNDAVLVF
jgi:hypothetical protein